MKPYAAWDRTIADRVYNCHCCGRIICQGIAARALDAFRVHESCVPDGTLIQLCCGLGEGIRSGRAPAHLVCPACGQRELQIDAQHGDVVRTGTQHFVRFTMRCACGACIKTEVTMSDVPRRAHAFPKETAPVGVYAGDGHPDLRAGLARAGAIVERAEAEGERRLVAALTTSARYDADPAEPEPESEGA